jgi:hypothetical protein
MSSRNTDLSGFQQIITSAKEVMFSSLSVCLSFIQSVILSVCSQDISKSYERISVKLSGMIGHVPRTNRLDFGEDPDVFVDPGSRISPESMDLFV